MIQTPPEVRPANWVFILFWIIIALLLWIFGSRWQATRAFRERMIAAWKPGLPIALLFIVSMGIAGRGCFNPYAVAIFCQALVGQALARGSLITSRCAGTYAQRLDPIRDLLWLRE